MTCSDQFQFHKSQCLANVTILRAQMEGFNYARHSHEEYAFGITLSGQQIFFSQGEYHQSNAGDVILFNPGDIHDGNSGGDEALNYFMLYVPEQKLRQYLEGAGLPEKQEIRLSDAVVKHPKLRDSLLNLTLNIYDGKTDPFEQEEALFKVADILVEKYGRIDQTYPKNMADTLILKAKDYIHENITNEISLEEISREVNISKFHFLRLFRQQLGITPYQYVLNHRVNQARKALTKSNSLNDVVFDFGFADLSHFNRRFKSVFGVTPKSYMKALSA